MRSGCRKRRELSTQLRYNHGHGEAWPEQAIFALDRWLRARQGIYEYTHHAQCLFRIQRAVAERSLSSCNGTRVRRGDSILVLHLWNEHIPVMGHRGPTLAWARQTVRALDTSLRELATYLRLQRGNDSIRALCGDMCLGTAAQCEQLERIVARYGFEAVAGSTVASSGSLHRLGENILILMLALATNRATLHTAILRRYRKPVILPRAALEQRYGPDNRATSDAHRSPMSRGAGARPPAF